MYCQFWITKLRDGNAFMIKGILDARRRFCSVSHGDHDRRHGRPGFLPCLVQHLPILAQQIVRLRDQIRQRFFRLGGAVDIVFYRIVGIDVIELGFEGFCIRHSIVPNNDAGRFDKAGFDTVIQAKIADDPSEKSLFIILLAGRSKRSSRKIIASQNVPRLMNSIQTADPYGSLLFCFLLLFCQLCLVFGIFAPCVMCLIVYDKDIAGICHLTQHLAGVCLVTLGPALINAPPFGNRFLAVPRQGLPVGDHDFALMQLVHKANRDDAKLIIVILFAAGLQHLQAAFDGQAGCYDEDIFREAPILRICDLVADHPRDQHGHDGRLAAASAELCADAPECSSIAGDVNTNFVRGGSLCQPDERFHRVHLAEKELILPRFLIVPVLQQLSRNPGHAGISRFTPCFYAGTDLVHKRQLDELADIIVLVGALASYEIASGAAAWFSNKGLSIQIILPVMCRLPIGGIDYELVNAGH